MAEVKVPELAESISEGSIAQWLKQPGDHVEKGEYVLELETDKVNVEIISDYTGTLSEHLAEEGDTVQVGQAIAIVDENGSAAAAPKAEAPKVEEAKAEPVKAEQAAPAKEAPKAEAKESSSTQQVIASPAARKLAREKGIDLTQVPVADPLGRVRVQDVEAASNAPAAPAAPAAAPKQAPAAKQAAAPVEVNDDRIEVVKMTRRRQTIAKRLVQVQSEAAMLTTFNEVDLSAVMELRNRHKDSFVKTNDVKLGFMSFFTKAVIGALKKYPLLNAEIQGDHILKKNFYDIGVAVSTDEGLVVPVVRDADRKSFAEIEKNISDLAVKARNNKLGLSDLSGGTFTITNGGTFGSLLSTPILNAPQVGILGMHTIKTRPIAVGDQIENRPMMYLALSYDHRIVDGKEAVGFLVAIKDMLEDPEQLLLQG
ncbi:2-oxoglutarate dehydrogenase complex dihydrolipoyllysine-residue succinyltransferase [Peribacillus frigoritolerans]|jgi:2-oxoglutarate dehydrogenase E2 component (dihydrolipoamide succinyltransferase)|uniref:Dihydrolipoyllysine-residue succinyltransferase component of 2-oxoglutarate dehydrogenase complex n=1 Tax=Peribacillus castrilensis TaxID=2897690 RepID=A0AAW9N565_9BACI|nr:MULTISPECIES: 2-oxoglutarate dehydrogenase complex dihydrolipoyllysine-residue succinyltransferase [Peribacillus]KRF51567.1 dihydrolipoamide succinyltransferase [Bacillus sp. Soil745]MEC0272911.1 2-oxoglutarate dehydrogenase complex dihydrolipoyllysine-residue succinyltransferase [Peribacillus castrilensis]PEF38462.1 dihydrolipoyllysine-residue succinyltransferase [Bacillus sp. AFS094228]PEO44147.1 dihydrolipoyllysine-residue succinyltransferase [Bacillus sp. AFS026049]PHD70384.1 dihydrolip